MHRPWYIGNTTVRNPYRLKDGLLALLNSPLQGNIRNRSGDKAFAQLLSNAGLVSIREDMPDATYSIGRKWRSALSRMGFLYPKVSPVSGFDQSNIGPVDWITPSGKRLTESKSVAGDQECYLRALAGQVISHKTLNNEVCIFNPLSHVLTIMKELERETGDPHISAIELALGVFTSLPQDPICDVIDNLLNLRRERALAPMKKVFDTRKYKAAAEQIDSDKPHTFKDYLDANTRYLKATGLFQAKGTGLTLIPEKKELAYQILSLSHAEWDSEEALFVLCNGVSLPTDEKDVAIASLEKDLQILKKYGMDYQNPRISGLGIEEIQLVRHEVQEKISLAKENRYALEQKDAWVEIGQYIEMLSKREYRRELDDDYILSIPKSEAPAYMEWAIWRAFLAMDSMISAPYEARRFRVDQDFLPLSTAPGRGSDLIIEFDDCVIAVEVTLTNNSRQEAAEGEPVRRHVADLVSLYPNKKVAGLFIANNIDSNTAETFRIGSWYDQDDNKSELTIVPIRTESFGKLFQAIFYTKNCTPEKLKQVMWRCSEKRIDNEAPVWKKEIDSIIDEAVLELTS